MSFTTILKIRWTGIPVMGLLALSVAILATLLLPGRAEAQQEQAAKNTTTVVGPGESLWSIAQARLGPDESPQQVAVETDRIYALNRDRIGADPNFVLVGQEILVSPVMSSVGVGGEEPRANEESAAASDTATAEGNEEPAADPAKDPAAKVAADPAAEEKPAPSNPEGVGGIAGERQILGLALRQILGLALLMLALLMLAVLIAIVMQWRLPMNRPERGSSHYLRALRRLLHQLRSTPPIRAGAEGGEEQASEQAEVDTTTAATSAAPATTGRAGSHQRRLRRIPIKRTPGGR